MIKVDIQLTRAENNFTLLNLETEGPFRSASDMVLSAFTAAYKENRDTLGLSLEEGWELLGKLQNGDFGLTQQRNGMAITTSFGHLAIQWENHLTKDSLEMINTVVTLATVEGHPDPSRKAVSTPVYGIPASDFHTSLEQLLSEDAKQPVTVPTFGPAPVETKQETTWRAFYEGSFLRSWPAEKQHTDLTDIHLMVSVDTHRICSLHGAQNPCWFEFMAFSGDYPDNSNPFRSIRSWWAGLGVVPFRNCSGGENGEELARKQWQEIDNVLRILSARDEGPGLSVGEVFILGSAAGVELKIKRVYPPFDLFFQEQATI